MWHGKQTPTESKFKVEAARISASPRSLLQLKRFSNRKLEPRWRKKCRAAIGDVEAFREDEKRRKGKKTLWRSGIEEVLMDLSKVKNLFVGAAETWRGLGPRSFECCAECLRQSLKVGEQPEMWWSWCRDLLWWRNEEKNIQRGFINKSHQLTWLDIWWAEKYLMSVKISVAQTSARREMF